jgi:hypothetical protein
MEDSRKDPMLRTVSIVCVLALFITFSAVAADVSGKWTAMVPGRGGEPMKTDFTFKVDGDKLTGTTTGPQGDVPIKDGKVSGDTISFTQTLSFGGNDVKLIYKGKVSGDEIKFTREREGGQAREFTAKRAGS